MSFEAVLCTQQNKTDGLFSRSVRELKFSYSITFVYAEPISKTIGSLTRRPRVQYANSSVCKQRRHLLIPLRSTRLRVSQLPFLDITGRHGPGHTPGSDTIMRVGSLNPVSLTAIGPAACLKSAGPNEHGPACRRV